MSTASIGSASAERIPNNTFMNILLLFCAMKRRVERVLVFGTFDLFHKGHEHFLNQAKRYGDELYVVIARDDTVQKVKNRRAVHDQNTRKCNVQRHPGVHTAIIGREGDKYAIIEKIKPDSIVLGYDQTHFTRNLAEELLKRKIACRIVRLRKAHNPHIYKTSILRKKQGLLQ